MKVKRIYAPVFKNEKFTPYKLTAKKTKPPLYSPYQGRGDISGSSKSSIKKLLKIEKYIIDKHLQSHYDAIANLATRPGGAYGRSSDLKKKAFNTERQSLNEGDFVVLFSDRLESGIVLSPYKDMNADLNVLVLLQRGETVTFKQSDIVLCFPDFVDASMAQKASNPNFISNSSTSDLNPSMHLDSEVAFQRSLILKRLTIFRKETELALQTLTPAFEALYLAKDVQKSLQDLYVSTPDIAEKLVQYTRASLGKALERDEVSEVGRTAVVEKEKQKIAQGSEPKKEPDYARTVLEEIAKTRSISMKAFLNPQSGATLFATHQLLFRHSEIFLWDTLQHKITQTFTIRPLEDRQALSKVRGWLQSSLYISDTGQDPSSDPIRSFALKAKQIIQERRDQGEAVSARFVEKPREIVIDTTSRPEIQWNASDIEILQCLRAGLGKQARAGDQDIFDTIMAHIAKLCGISLNPNINLKADETNRDETRSTSLPQFLGTKLLQSLGIMTPWENVPNMDIEFQSLVSKDLSQLYKGQGHSLVDLDEKSREDFDLPVYVIDDATAEELDDGIAIEKLDQDNQYQIHILIADPTSSLTIDDPIAVHARRRYNSYYHPDGYWPMLPDALTKQYGLRSGNGTNQVKNALRLSAKIDINNGQIAYFNIGLVRLSNVQVKSYDDVDRIISGGVKTESKEEEDVKVLHRIAMKLAQRRRNIGGAFEATYGGNLKVSLDPLPLPYSPLWQLDGENFLSRLSLYAGFPKINRSLDGINSSSSRVIVSELMILAGRICGTWATECDVPLVFRVQKGPSSKDRDHILRLRDENGIIPFENFLKSEIMLASGTSSVVAGEHFAMGINTRSTLKEGDIDAISMGGYARTTSPLRRYTDLLNHWQIKARLRGESVSPNSLSFSTRGALLKQLSHFDRMDQWSKFRQRASHEYYFILKLQRGLQCKRGELKVSEEEKEDVDELLNGVYDATVIRKEVRTTQAYQGAIRVHITALGCKAEMKWNLKLPGPTMAQKVKVKIVDAFVAGPASYLIVEEAT